MSKTVPIDHEFNREKFAELLMRAKGGRTQTRFANDCGLSASHLNRYYNMQKEQPPIPSTIFKISQNAENDVTLEELLDAAGYDPAKNYASKRLLSYAKYSNNMFERLCVSRLMLCLSDCAFKWSVPSADGKLKTGGWRPDLEIDLEGNDILNHWLFEVKNLAGNTQYKSWLVHFFGSICLQKLLPKTKISIVVESEESLKLVKEFPPLALPVYFSVIIFDMDSDRIVKEEYLPTALELTDALTTVFSLDGNDDH